MKEEVVMYDKQSEGLSLKDVILKLGEWRNYLLSKWIIILIIATIGGLLGLAYASFKKTMYIATTSFVLEDGGNSGGLGQYGGLASMVGVDVGGGGGGIFQGDNILELYKSRVMIEKALLTQIDINGKSQLLLDSYINISGLRKNWDKNPKLKGVRFAQLKGDSLYPKPDRLKDSILGRVASDIVKNYLKVYKPDKKLNLIMAEVKAPDEFFAKTFNEQIVKNVNDFYVQTKTKKSLDNILILQQKTDSVRSVMNGSIFNAAVVTDATPNLNPTRQLQRTVPVQRSQFSVESNKLLLTELVKNLELSKISLRKEAPLIQVVDRPILPLQEEKIGKLKGIVLGSILGGFAICSFLIIRRLLKLILA